MNSPCKACIDRYSGCHSKCEKYKTFRQELDTQRELVQKARDEYRLFEKGKWHQQRI